MKIKSIEIIDSSGKSQKMDFEEAKKLYASLDEIFGHKTKVSLPINTHIDSPFDPSYRLY